MDYHFKITFSIKLETLTFPLLPVLGAAAVSIGIRGSCFLFNFNVMADNSNSVRKLISIDR